MALWSRFKGPAIFWGDLVARSCRYERNEEFTFSIAIVFDEDSNKTFVKIGKPGQTVLRMLLTYGHDPETVTNICQDLLAQLVSKYGWQPTAVKAHLDLVNQVLADEDEFTKSHVPSGALATFKDIKTCLEFASAEGGARQLQLHDDAYKARDRLKSNTSKCARQFCTLSLGKNILVDVDDLQTTKISHRLHHSKLLGVKLQAKNIRTAPGRQSTPLWVRVKADLYGIVQTAGKDPPCTQHIAQQQ